ncbi:DUF4062 domain-containing protein [Microbacterium sp. zg.Y909]|uniref:DUF4062 domain-containing protein n=1 Tax=Microbacterium sp. zg.Y909 TaxID=2969413 RepID=UPI00214BD2D8|nr:DUF4062 domain-containing protein [Microbacterium sp. zg.Y909]MCR2824294.1 DUF4062 domain-containing protein [Microbacterium sp. zg.Y909]
MDLASSQVPPDEADVRLWAAQQSVFVSSLIGDMRDERVAVRAAVTSFGARPVMFEHDLGGQEVPADRAYLDGLAGSTIYLGIYGPRYGQPLGNGYSATHDEYRNADIANMRMALFVRDPFGGADGPQQDFVGGLRARYTTAPYADAAQLGQRVQERLRVMATESLTPWMVLGDTAFRANSTHTSGDTIGVRATIRSGRVAELVKGFPGARGGLGYAGAHDSAEVRVTDVSTESTSAGSQTLEITMKRAGQQQHPTPMSINGMSADDVFEKALRGALFGEPVENPFWGLATIEDPLEILRGRNLPDPVVRSLARVLTDEALRHRGIKGGTSKFTLGPPKAEGRLLEVSWFPPRRYVNEPTPAERAVTGTVAPI